MVRGSSRSHAFSDILMRLVSLVLFLSLVWSGSVQAMHGGSDREVEAGDVLPLLSRKTVEGTAVMIPSKEGITVLVFWATWSPRSKQALELWDKFREEYRDQPLTIITVNAEREALFDEELRAIDSYIKENIPDLPVILDEGLEMFNTYAVKAVPTVFFLESSGKVLFRYPSFPSSAALDLQDEMEITLGLKQRKTEQEKDARGKLEYQPENNALLYYNLGVQLYKKGFREKALERMVIALQRDPNYRDPLRAMEGIFFQEGRTPGTEAELRDFLTENGLDGQVDRIGEGDPILIEAPKRIKAMERLRQLMEKKDSAGGASQ